MIERLSAITLATHDMTRAVQFYRMLGFELKYGGADAAFTSFRAGAGYLNLISQPGQRRWMLEQRARHGKLAQCARLHVHVRGAQAMVALQGNGLDESEQSPQPVRILAAQRRE